MLLDTEPLLAKAWKETSKKYNYFISEENLNELKGRRKIDCAKKVLKWINKEISIEELLLTQKSKLSNQLHKAKPFKGAIDLVEFCLKINLPIALVTSSSSDSFKIKSSLNPWLNLFPIRILGDDPFISSGKPSPEPYRKAIQLLKVDPQKTWVIEDSYSGALAGLKAGCNLFFFSKDNEIFNQLLNEFQQENINKINELSEIIYFLKFFKGFCI